MGEAKGKVLITGMSGLIGGAVRKQLDGKYRLAALNRSAIPGVECHRADIADLRAIRPAFDGVDVVVHLAAASSGAAGWDDVLRHNVTGTYNVFEAARQAGVKRVVFASSGATITGYEREPPLAAVVGGRYDEVVSFPVLTHETPTRPITLYGCSKVWGETLARYYVDVHGLSAVCVRIGHVSAEDRPLNPREFEQSGREADDRAARFRKGGRPTRVPRPSARMASQAFPRTVGRTGGWRRFRAWP
jgi:nucleoside-diphosphate-sugar epimerase